jgi:site-specific recombinase XerC
MSAGRFHDLRHTFASRLVEKGVDIIRVKELLGHSSVKITERYTHSNREERRKAVELLCQKSAKAGENLENLSHSCDMEKSRKRSKIASSLFSVN